MSVPKRKEAAAVVKQQTAPNRWEVRHAETKKMLGSFESETFADIFVEALAGISSEITVPQNIAA